MADKTHADELIDFTSEIIDRLANCQELVGLVLNDQNIDLSSEAAEKIYDHIFDYDYVDDTIEESGVYITVDADINRITGSTKDVTVYVQVSCTKNMMRLKGFKGLKGNRLLNVIRYVDLAINGSTAFGIGRLQLKNIKSVTAVKPFASKVMTYSVPAFRMNRDMLPEVGD